MFNMLNNNFEFKIAPPFQKKVAWMKYENNAHSIVFFFAFTNTKYVLSIVQIDEQVVWVEQDTFYESENGKSAFNTIVNSWRQRI